MPNNSLDKASWELVEILKETTKKNLVAAVNTEQLKISQDVLPKLFTLLDSSVAEAYNKSYKNFSNKFEKISKQVADQDGSAQGSKKRK